jgi:hypothetical protein
VHCGVVRIFSALLEGHHRRQKRPVAEVLLKQGQACIDARCASDTRKVTFLQDRPAVKHRHNACKETLTKQAYHVTKLVRELSALGWLKSK